jgi:hypothetical protein
MLIVVRYDPVKNEEDETSEEDLRNQWRKKHHN